MDSGPLLDMPFCKYFPQSVVSVHILLTVSFTVQNSLILIKSSLSLISFMGHTFGVIAKKALPYPRPSSFCPMFASGSFTVLYFTLRSLIHLSSFCEGCEVCV